MVQAGDVLTSPDGDRLVFNQTSADTGGERLEVEVFYAPHAPAPVTHFHPSQAETFTVLAGALTTVVGGEERVYHAGETFTVPPGTPHRMHNAEDVETHARWVTQPALDTESFFATVWALDAAGSRSLLQLAVVRLASPVQRGLIALLAPIGRLRGYQPTVEPPSA